MNDAEFAVISSIFTLGGLLGALCAGPLSTSYGRRMPMRLTAVFFIIGSIMEAVATNIPIISIGRLLSGVGAGAALVVVPLYIAEVSPPKEKGLFGVMTQITINVGIVITQTLGYLLSKGAQWRIVLVTGAGIAVLQIIGLFFIPESPAWMAANKNPQQALETLQRIRGKGVDVGEETQTWDAVPQNSVLESEGLLRESLSRHPSTSSIASSRKSIPHVGFFQVAHDPLYRPAIIAVVGTMFAQQFCGINSVMMYSVSLLSDMFPGTSGLLTIFLSVANLFMTILCAPLADKLGRKVCLIWSISGMGTSAFLLAFSILYGIQIMSFIAILFFVLSFAVGLGPIPFILASELVGQEAKGATQSWALASNWIFTFLVAQFFPIINELLNTKLGGSGWVYFIFAGLALVSAGFVGWRVPETVGKRDADEVWGRIRRD
jgi:sugar porter (SP) family MFS transporter